VQIKELSKDLDATNVKLEITEHSLLKMKLKYEREKEELGSDEAAPEVAVQTDIGADFFEEIDD
jgi:hypothetical protein